MTDRFAGKVAIVTGGASGIGGATSRRLAAEGAMVVVVDLQSKAGEALAAELGHGAFFHRMDITDEQAWTTLVSLVKERCGRLDIMAHCAGIDGFGTVEDTSVAVWQRVLSVNTLGTFLANHHAVRMMRDSGGGSIVNVASANALRANAGQIAYCASKAAVLQITRCTALHCGQKNYNIRCNSVLPGAVDTPLLATLEARLGGRAELEARVSARHALGRMGQPEEIASTIAYLASDDASFITAASFAADGGMCEI